MSNKSIQEEMAEVFKNEREESNRKVFTPISVKTILILVSPFLCGIVVVAIYLFLK